MARTPAADIVQTRRIQFGYDSAYEEVRARNDARYSSKPITLRDQKPANQFRLGF